MRRLPTGTVISRRAFLATAACAAGGVAGACLDTGIEPRLSPPTLLATDPKNSGIEHVVLVMMENRSFDHFLGWLPRADGRQAGLTYLDANGVAHDTWHLAPDFQGCGYQDPDHTAAGGRVEYNNGACDGWLRVNDAYSLGYYNPEDLAFLGRAAPYWTSFDRYFCPIMAETFPNRFYQHAGQTDRPHNTLEISTLPTIWDRVAARGLRGTYYYSDTPFLGLWGSKYLPISASVDEFVADCAAGTLPHVSYVDPRVRGGTRGTSGDDHPFSDIRAGETFLNRIYAAVTSSPSWGSTVLFITFDEWGGFFDHVPPPAGPIADAERALGNADGLRGFRTPAVLISPFARRGRVSHVLYDHCSLLRLIEWRWRLEPLAPRDRAANNLALELSAMHRSLAAPVYQVPSITSVACPTTTAAHWDDLGELARHHGWSV